MCRIQTNGRNLYDRMILILQAHATHQINRANACITANEWYHPAIFFISEYVVKILENVWKWLSPVAILDGICTS